MTVLKSSSAATSYYEKDDYYLNRQGADGPSASGSDGTGGNGSGGSDASAGDGSADGLGGDGKRSYGTWFGKGAASVGLEGDVDPDDFKSVLDGRLPNGVVLGTMKDGKLTHTPGWDLTFSAPKSVSILIEVAKDERVLQAHENAVKDALTWTEENALGSRKRSFLGRLFESSGSMVAALFTHHTSREQDPNTHTHAVVANATEREDGDWRSVFSKPLFEHKMAAGNVYRASLAQQLKELGYAIEQTSRDGRFEVADVPSDLIDRFSKRRKDIESVLNRWETDDASSAARATLLTRPSKRLTDREVLEQRWQSETGDIDLSVVVNNAREKAAESSRSGAPADLSDAVKTAIERLSEPEAVFSNADLVRWTLAAAMGKGTVKDAEEAIRQFERDGRLHRINEHGRALWTTPRALEQERRVLRAVNESKGAVTPVDSPRSINATLESTTLSEEQKAAARLVLSSSDRFVGILGRPGTGKTFLLSSVREIAESRGYTVTGMSQNANAARNLQEQAGITSSTIHKHLAKVGSDLAVMQKGNTLEKMMVERGYRNQIWVVDEASQLPSSLTRRLMFAADRLGARMVFVGDPQQLPAIEAGKPFALMLKSGMKHAELTEIRRQRDSGHREAIRDAIRGDVDSAIDRLLPNITVLNDRGERLKAMLRQYRNLGDARADTLLLTARAQDKAALNAGVREILRGEGKLRDETGRTQLARVFSRRADRKNAEFYQNGDLVRFTGKADSLGIEAGDYRRVVGTNPRSNLVTLETLDSSSEIRWNPNEVAAGSKHGVEVYRPKDTTLAPGEPIRWTRNVKELNLVNGERLTVESVTKDKTVVVKENREKVELPASEVKAQHWEHAYAGTVYSSQGQTVPHAIVNADSSERELFSQKAFLVAISRHQERISLYTDDKDELVKTLRKQLGDKSSAIESMEASRWTKALPLLDKILSAWRPPEREQPLDRGRDLSI